MKKNLAKSVIFFLAFSCVVFGIAGANSAQADFLDDVVDVLDPTNQLDGILEGNPFGFGDPVVNIITGTTPTLPDPEDLLSPPLKPIADTKGVHDVERTSAKLEGYVNPKESASTNVFFQFGKTEKLGNRSKGVRVLVPSNVEIELAKLDPCTKYFYQVVARNNLFTEKGGVKSFTTKGCDENPTPTPTPTFGFCTHALTLSEVEEAIKKGKIELGKPNVDTGEGIVKNHTDCPLQISLAVYTFDDPNDILLPKGNKPGPNDFTFQTRFDVTHNVVITAKSNQTLVVNLPKCNFQMDYFYDDSSPEKLERGQTSFLDGGSNSYALDAEAFGGKSCGGNPTPTPTPTVTPTPPPGDFNAICVPSESSIRVNNSVTYRVDISNGTAPFGVSWSGSENLSGTGQQITKSYGDTGDKVATATVTDAANRTKVVSCNISVVSGSSSSHGGGSSRRKPRVTLTERVEEAPLAAGTVYLSEVPYTGLTEYPRMALFLFALMFWSVFISVILMIVRSRKNKKISRVANFITETRDDAFLSEKPQEVVMDEKNMRFAYALRKEAEKQSTTLSDGAVKSLIVSSKGNIEHAIMLLRSIIDASRTPSGEKLPLVLHEEKIKEILFGSYLNLIPHFIDSLFHGNEELVFDFLNTLKSNGHSVKDFINHVIFELRMAIENRQKGSMEPNKILLTLSRFENDHLEEVVHALSYAVEEGHRAPFISAKLSLLRALKIAREI